MVHGEHWSQWHLEEEEDEMREMEAEAEEEDEKFTMRHVMRHNFLQSHK